MIGVSVSILVIAVGMFLDWYIHEGADMSVSVFMEEIAFTEMCLCICEHNHVVSCICVHERRSLDCDGSVFMVGKHLLLCVRKHERERMYDTVMYK